jgi:hypothetical protein
LGVLHPDHLRNRLTNQQLLDWSIYFDKFGFGESKREFLFAMIAHQVACTIPIRPGQSAPRFSNYLYSRIMGNYGECQGDDEQFAIAQLWAAAYGNKNVSGAKI